MANNPNYDGMAEPDKTLVANTVTGNYGELPKASTKKKKKNDKGMSLNKILIGADAEGEK